LYISKDDGANWEPFQLNLPSVPITDLALKENDLIVATQGRSFWILDDLNVIWDEMTQKTDKSKLRMYQSYPTVGIGGSGRTSKTEGTNHARGIRFHMNIPDVESEVQLKFMDARGGEIRTFSTKAKKKSDKIELEEGMNTFDWDMRYEKADKFDGLLMWWGTLNGPTAPPAMYTAQLIVEQDTVEVPFELLLDPRSEGDIDDRAAQFRFLLEIRNKLDETHDAIRQMREVKAQISNLKSRIDSDKYSEVVKEGERLDSLLTEIEKVLYQTKLKSNQDMLNYPIRLNNKLAHVASLASMGIYRPTDQMIKVKDDITAKINVELKKWYAIRDNELDVYNDLIRDSKVDVIGVQE
jgi:hypothetical protein